MDEHFIKKKKKKFKQLQIEYQNEANFRCQLRRQTKKEKKRNENGA